MEQTAPSATFAALLRRYRQAAGLTQEELAERARLSARGIADLERGVRRAPRKDTVELLAEALALGAPERAAFAAAARHAPNQPRPEHERLEDRRILPFPTQEAAGLPTSTPVYGGFLGAVPTGPLVGQEDELGRLLAALESAAAGQGRLVLLAGEPGVGKTRLAQELALRAGERGFRVLTARCYEQYMGLPFSPWVEILSSGLRLASPALRHETPRRFPYLGRLLPDLLDHQPAAEGEDVQLRIVRAASGFLAALAAEAPLAVLVDDLHWADRTSLDALLHLARQMRGDRILLAGTYREVGVRGGHPLAGALAEMVRERLALELRLQGLSPDATGALIGVHLRQDRVSVELRDLLVARTRGNPFFVEELLKALQEEGASARAGEGWASRVLDAIAVPRGVRAVVDQRVGRLAPETQRLLSTAGVLGQEWDLELLLGAADMDQETALRSLEAALAAGLLEERCTGPRERYAFTHALVEQALYEALPGFRRRALHRRAGEALARLRGERAESWAALARHFLAAGEQERATHYTLLAGGHAAGLYAHAEALQHYEAALAWLAEAGDERGVARTREKLGVVLYTAGRYDEALAALGQVAETYRAAGDLLGLARVTARMGWAHGYRGTGEEGLAYLRPVLARVETGGPSPELVELYGAMALLLLFTSRYGDYYATSRRAVDVARAVGDDRLLAVVECHLGSALLAAGPVEQEERLAEARRMVEAAARRSEAAGDLENLYHCTHTAAMIQANRGELAGARLDYQRALLLAERLGDPSWIAWAAAHSGRVAFLAGAWDEARVELERALALAGQTTRAWTTTYALLYRGVLHLAEGEWEEAERLLREAGARSGQGGDLQGVRAAAGSLADLDLYRGDAVAARARLLPLLDRPGQGEVGVMNLLPRLAQAHLDLCEVVEAEQVVAQALWRARSEGLRVAFADTLRVQALILIRQGRYEDGERVVQEGLALARALPYPYAEARLLLVHGRLAALQDQVEPARERLQAALAIFRRLGAHKDVEQAEQALATR